MPYGGVCVINYGNCFRRNRARAAACVAVAFRSVAAPQLDYAHTHTHTPLHFGVDWRRPHLPIQRLSVNGEREVAGTHLVGDPKLNLTLLFGNCARK